MKNLVIGFILLVFIVGTSSSQRHSAVWVVGYSADQNHPPVNGKTELHFSDSGLRLEYRTLEKEASTFFINSSISDSSGQLLMFTEGLNIYGEDQKYIQNGDGLNPGRLRDDYNGFYYPSIYNHIFLNAPDNSEQYYLIHLAVRYNEDVSDTIRGVVADKLYATTIKLVDGKPYVSEKNKLLIEGEFVEGHMAYCKHANGRDWWIVVEEYGSNLHYMFLLDNQGIRLHHKQSIGYGGNFYDYSGNSIFSRDGTKFAKYTYLNSIQIFDFDRCSGLFSNPVHLNVRSFNRYFLGSLAFSPEGKYLYFNNYNRVFQFDMKPNNGNYSMDTVGIWDGYYYKMTLPTAFFNMALGDDGVIYIGCYSSNVYLHTIRNSDLKGSQCGFELRSVKLPAYMSGALPIMPNFKLGPVMGSMCDSLTKREASICETADRILHNLCHDEIFLNQQIGDGTFLNLYSIQGKFLQKLEVRNSRIDISVLCPGIFILACEMEGVRKGLKFVKI